MKPGDIIKTSYNTGPYIIVKVTQTQDGLIHLTLKAALADDPRAKRQTYWINNIQRVDDRWIANGRDEIYIIQESSAEPIQLRLF